MSKTWTFIGGMIAGVVSVFAAATAAVALEEKQRTDVILDEEDIEDDNVETATDKSEDVVEAEAETT